jgi:hypothetical protein
MIERIPQHHYSIEDYERVRQKKTHLFDLISDDKLLEIHDELVKRAEYLESKYPNANEYAMYHVLIGSTIGERMSIMYDDFPDDDSVELYLDNLIFIDSIGKSK